MLLFQGLWLEQLGAAFRLYGAVLACDVSGTLNDMVVRFVYKRSKVTNVCICSVFFGQHKYGVEL